MHTRRLRMNNNGLVVLAVAASAVACMLLFAVTKAIPVIDRAQIFADAS